MGFVSKFNAHTSPTFHKKDIQTINKMDLIRTVIIHLDDVGFKLKDNQYKATLVQNTFVNHAQIPAIHIIVLNLIHSTLTYIPFSSLTSFTQFLQRLRRLIR